jgi:hypothetical protein
MRLEPGIVDPGLNQEVVNDAAKLVMHRLIARFIARDPLLIDRAQASLANSPSIFPINPSLPTGKICFDLLRGSCAGS